MKLLFLISLSIVLSVVTAGGLNWITTWGTAHTESGPTVFETIGGIDLTPQVFSNQTIRMIVRTTVKGDGFVRIRFSNAYPTLVNPSFSNNTSVTINEAHISYRDVGASIQSEKDRVLTFGGSQSVVIPPNADVRSDSVSLNIKGQIDLAITMYIVPTAPATVGTIYAARHAYTEQTSYIAGSNGNFASNVDGTPFNVTTTGWFLLSAVEVLSQGSTIVAFGDSITEGFCVTLCTLNTNTRYTDYLATALLSNSKKKLGVMNAGLSGNQLNYDSPSLAPGVVLFPFGPSGLSRFPRDALNVAGVAYIISLIGINDIVYTLEQLDPPNSIYAPIIFGYTQLIDQAHTNGIKIYGGTLLPYSAPPIGTFVEPFRQAINAWIRTSGAFDAVIDFDAAVRDPTNTSQLLPAYNSGDDIHPNSLGYQAIANAIDLDLFN